MTKKDEWRRGAKDARQAFELLRARWPKAFPAKSHEVRPLASAVPAIVEALGWSPQYAKGVLSVWKGREADCRAQGSASKASRRAGDGRSKRPAGTGARSGALSPWRRQRRSPPLPRRGQSPSGRE